MRRSCSSAGSTVPPRVADGAARHPDLVVAPRIARGDERAVDVEAGGGRRLGEDVGVLEVEAAAEREPPGRDREARSRSPARSRTSRRASPSARATGKRSGHTSGMRSACARRCASATILVAARERLAQHGGTPDGVADAALDAARRRGTCRATQDRSRASSAPMPGACGAACRLRAALRELDHLSHLPLPPWSHTDVRSRSPAEQAIDSAETCLLCVRAMRRTAIAMRCTAARSCQRNPSATRQSVNLYHGR